MRSRTAAEARRRLTGTRQTIVLAAVVACTFSPGSEALAQSSSLATVSDQACIGGFAGSWPCSNVDLLAYVSRAALGIPEGSLNDVWGWTDTESNREYALVGLSSGTAFVDITDPVAPRLLGSLPTQTLDSPWRDIKVYRDYAVIVSEATGHGMQIFDLSQLRSLGPTPATFVPTAVYGGIGSSHNVFVNETTGYAYAVGSRGGSRPCGTGLHIVDLRSPEEPAFAGCFTHQGTGRAGTGYTHDVQCVVYDGPDPDYTGREICFGSNETAVSIADVTDKSAPVPISIATYPSAESRSTYVHQGWLTEDHRYFLQDDELDESNGFVSRTTTRIWDMSDLDEPVLLTAYEGPTGAIDHNLYVRGDWVYMANYRSGLRVVDITDIMNAREIAFFDTYPANDGLGYNGAWSTYPYFESGSVLISSIGEGLFVVRPPVNNTNVEDPGSTEQDARLGIYPNPVRSTAVVSVRLEQPDDIRITVYDVIGRVVLELGPIRVATGVTQNVSLDVGDLPAGRYVVRVAGDTAASVRLLTVVS